MTLEGKPAHEAAVRLKQGRYAARACRDRMPCHSARRPHPAGGPGAWQRQAPGSRSRAEKGRRSDGRRDFQTKRIDARFRHTLILRTAKDLTKARSKRLSNVTGFRS